jgi:hypothetical protein
VILHSLQVDPAELAARTGWELKPEGACKGDRCVPLPGRTPAAAGSPDATLDAAGSPDATRDAAGSPAATLDAALLAERLGMALVSDSEHGLWALGPEAGGRALLSAQLPDLELPDRHGRPFSLRSLRGTRFVMIAWASW